MLTLMACLAFVAAARVLGLCRTLVHFELVRRSGATRWLSVELRRRAMVCKAPGDLQEFPQPREFRMLVLRLAGLALCARTQVVGLPRHFDSGLHLLRAEDFDAQFSGSFRAAGKAGIGVAAFMNPLHHA